MIDSSLANAIRVLTMDAVQKANSGHPGAPMGMAEMAVALWHRHLKHNPANPNWINRDRFVLSNGHGSMLLYSLLHLSGYDLSLEELKKFRQLHSKTPGHPERGYTPGVETTTGPLGQGITNAVGMALAEFQLAQEFNTSKHHVIDHFTYTFLGDGCMMEGISHESCSLAGTLRLSKLIALYDDNGISIDGDVDGWFTDNTAKRFAAYNWHVIDDVDGHNIDAVDAAITEAKAQSYKPYGKPTLIICKSIIGHGAPNKAGGHDVHGAPLGDDEITASKDQMGWNSTPFHVPDSVRKAWKSVESGQLKEFQWQKIFDSYEKANPELAQELLRRSNGELPKNFSEIAGAAISTAANSKATLATRKASQLALNALGNSLPELFGGSADLTGSNLTLFDGAEVAGRDKRGQHLSYGVREFAMAAVMNGMALHGGFIPYGGTFLTFSDYSRNAIRMAALMKIRLVHVFTHDSIGLGEDGPTHQSVEHVPSLRIIPHLDTWRPADELETMVAWVESLKRVDGPSALVLSRQSCPSATDSSHIDLISNGAYILSDRPDACAIIIATGSEVSIAIEAQKYLDKQNVPTRVVSAPCTNRFDRCDDAYRQAVIPYQLPIVAVEAAQTDGWHKYVGRRGVIIGINQFGESAPAQDLYRHFGITANAVAKAVLKLIA